MALTISLTRNKKIKTQLSKDCYLLQPMQLVQKRDGNIIALWSSEDALIITMLTHYLTPLLPVHLKREHIKGHHGGKRSIQRLDTLIKHKQYAHICRTDIKGYYANINKSHLLQQLRQYVSDPIALDLLTQFLYYSAEDGGNFHTTRKGIARSSSLSPLLGAFHLYCIDDYFAKQPRLYYARYMDDFIILTRTR
ncbi:hypothetical protein A6D99_00385 [Aliivibrio fischeri]|nr:hypothetical protein A6D99_00385 [Aliivibrio fischeri]